MRLGVVSGTYEQQIVAPGVAASDDEEGWEPSEGDSAESADAREKVEDESEAPKRSLSGLLSHEDPEPEAAAQEEAPVAKKKPASLPISWLMKKWSRKKL